INAYSGSNADLQLTIAGNRIGTIADGTAAIGSPIPTASGIIVNNAGGITIGGTTANAGNLISGNTLIGVSISFSSATPAPAATTIEGNFIGTDSTGASALFNLGFGIALTDAPNVTIGGTSA